MQLVGGTTAASQADGLAPEAKTRLVIVGTHPRAGWVLWRVDVDGVQPAGMADGMPTALGLCDSLAADVVVIDGSLDAAQLGTLAADLRERHTDQTILIITERWSSRAAKARVETATFANRLTRQEQQVSNLLRSGGSVSQIAGLLRMNVTTAKSYVSRVYHKLGASDRALALMAAVDHGLGEVALATAG